MQVTRYLRTGLVAAAAVALFGLAPTVASASEDTGSAFTDSELQEFRASMSELGIDAATEEALIAQLEQGVALDAWTGSNLVSTQTTEVDGYIQTMEVYADGSRNRTLAEVPQVVDGTFAARSVSCTVPNGPYPNGWAFSNCEIRRDSVGVTISYFINGNTRGNNIGAVARITNMGNVYCGITGAVGAPTASKEIRQASGTTAWAVGTCGANVGPIGYYTYGLRVNVSYGITSQNI